MVVAGHIVRLEVLEGSLIGETQSFRSKFLIELTHSIDIEHIRPRSGQLASVQKIEPWDGTIRDATQAAEGRARMCKDALLQVKENVFGVHRKGVVGRNRGGNIPKEPIVAHSAANPPHSSGQWMPTAISRHNATGEQRRPDNSYGRNRKA
ncbi:hypothetical protein G5I_04275 [Acromyrmex echinatior]|uniref:Uncharacterized protein n=1 Tax=Acromyrmex echinatior TaxID=103372 RepID=F4WF68_ACREC|nr:hypothetical protein G5I_04275 [Acromyrmex echinatior]